MNTVFRELTGLVAAPHTPMNADGSVNFGAIGKQAERLVVDGVAGAFICGSTGEGQSLSSEERRRVAEQWREAIGTGPLRLIVHAGHNSLEEAKLLAGHARRIGADAVSLMAPSYFKPTTVEDLLDFCAPVAVECAELPFYFYDIPSMTGVSLSMLEFLQKGGSRIPNLAGLKFTSTNFTSLQECLNFEGGRFTILFGCDEMLLAALALGVRGAVGSTYNYCAPLYRKLIAAQAVGDAETARRLQLKSVRLVKVLSSYGLMAAGKAAMNLVGVDCGPVRPPLRRLTEEQKAGLLRQIKDLDIVGPDAGAGEC